MRGNKGKDTRPELALRSLLYHRGLRYRVDARPLAEIRRKADVVFPSDRLAVFVDGCFWHGCPEHYRPAVKKAEFWRDKITGNRARDADTNDTLLAAGWQVLRIWEHEDPASAAERVIQRLQELRS
nr:very short patch repair endonuclease [Actinokineospora inagensis]